MRPLLLFIFILLPVFAWGQQPFIRDFWIDESNTALKINAVIQDTSGYVWLGTDNGVYRFNGRSFVLIPDSIHKPVTALASSNGIIYAGYNNGVVSKVINNKSEKITVIGNVPTKEVKDIAVNGDLILLCNEEGVYGILNSVSFLMNTSNGLSDNYCYTLETIAPGMLTVGTDKGINVITELNGKMTIKKIQYRDGVGLPDNIIRVLKPGKNANSFWVGTEDGGAAVSKRDNNGNIHFIGNAKAWHWGQVNDIIVLSETSAWIATDLGFLIKATVTDDSLKYSPYNIGKSIRRIAMGVSGNIWCATAEGITMVTAEYIQYIKMPSDFSLHNITAISCDKKNMFWYGSDKVLYNFSLSDTDIRPHRVFSFNSTILSLYVDVDNSLWIGTFGDGLWHCNKNRVVQVKDVPTINRSSILSITGKKGFLWISSLNGVEETKVKNVEKGTLELIKHHDKQSGVGSDYVYQLFCDIGGQVWMATDGAGICMYDGKVYHHWDSSEGMPEKVIYSVGQDADSSIWIGALDKGLYFYDGFKKWFNAYKRTGVQDRDISAIAGNGTCELISVHQRGIEEWYPLSHEFRHINKRFLSEIDSMSQVLNCITKDTAENVYVPFNKGFIVMPNQYANYKITPKVQVSSVSVFLQPLAQLQNVFSYNQNYLTISFDGINYTNSDPIIYRYRLDGYNTKWIYTNDESVTFPQLPPGKYTFHVEASLNKIFYNSGKTSYSFIITTPFWKEKWFYVLVVIVLASLIYGYIYAREIQLKKMSTLQRERMMFEYEHLKSQVNPHFLFNSLNTLTNLIEEDKDAAVHYTSQLSDLYRHMLAYHEKDLVLLSEEWEILSGYMFIQKSRFGSALRMESDIPVEILRSKKVVPLSLQIAVENAIKHNVVSASRPLTIYIGIEGDYIIVRNKLKPKLSKEKGAGLGLANISKRYELLSKKQVSYGVVNDEFVVKLPLL